MTRRRDYTLRSGAYYRIGWATSITDEECHGCNTKKVCLCTDNSQGEYTGIVLCLDCITKIIRQEDL